MHPDTINFLSLIKENNNRNFFGIIKPLYEQVREQLVQFTVQLVNEIKKFDDSISDDLDPKKCLFRIYRDARRLKEGDPVYKTNFGLSISPDGKNDTRAGYYLHIQPGESFFGGGIYRPTSEELLNLRHYLAKFGDQYIKLTTSKEFVRHFGEVQGATTTRLPKGFDNQTAFLDIVKKKQHLIYHKLSDKQILSENFMKIFLDLCQTAMPRFHFLNKGYGYTARKKSQKKYIFL